MTGRENANVNEGSVSEPLIGGVGALALDHVFVAEKGGPYIYHGTRGGGSVWNALAHLAAAGHRTKAFGSCGENEQGREALYELSFLGVDTSAISSSTYGATPVYTQWLDETNRQGPAIPQDNFTLACPVCERLPDESVLIQFSPPGFDEDDDFGCLPVICFDRLTDSTVGAARKASRAGGIASIDLGGLSGLKLRDKSELLNQLKEFEMVSMPRPVASWITSDRPDELAAMLFSGKTRILATTNGPDGFCVFARTPSHGVVRASSPAPFVAHVVDSCGAGDAFMAALISYMARNGERNTEPSDLALPAEAFDEFVQILREAPGDVLLGIGARSTFPEPPPHTSWGKKLKEFRGHSLKSLRTQLAQVRPCLFCSCA